jgi:hypothetical protein
MRLSSVLIIALALPMSAQAEGKSGGNSNTSAKPVSKTSKTTGTTAVGPRGGVYHRGGTIGH